MISAKVFCMKKFPTSSSTRTPNIRSISNIPKANEKKTIRILGSIYDSKQRKDTKVVSLDDYNKRIKELKDEIEQLKISNEQKKKYEDEVNTLQNQNEALLDSSIALEEENANLRDQLHEKEKENADLRNQLSRKEQLYDVVDNRTKELLKEKENLTNKCNILLGAIYNMRDGIIETMNGKQDDKIKKATEILEEVEYRLANLDNVLNNISIRDRWNDERRTEPLKLGNKTILRKDLRLDEELLTAIKTPGKLVQMIFDMREKSVALTDLIKQRDNELEKQSKDIKSKDAQLLVYEGVIRENNNKLIKYEDLVNKQSRSLKKSELERVSFQKFLQSGIRKIEPLLSEDSKKAINEHQNNPIQQLQASFVVMGNIVFDQNKKIDSLNTDLNDLRKDLEKLKNNNGSQQQKAIAQPTSTKLLPAPMPISTNENVQFIDLNINPSTGLANGEGTIKSKKWPLFWSGNWKDGLIDVRKVEFRYRNKRSVFERINETQNEETNYFDIIPHISRAVAYEVIENPFTIKLYNFGNLPNSSNKGSIFSQDSLYFGGMMNGEPHGHGIKYPSTGELLDTEFEKGEQIEIIK